MSVIEITAHLKKALLLLEGPQTRDSVGQLVREIQKASAGAISLECEMRGVPSKPLERDRPD